MTAKLSIFYLGCLACVGASGYCFTTSMRASLPPLENSSVPASTLLASSSRVFGRDDAAWKVVEFTDYECPPCRHADQRAREKFSHQSNVAWYVHQNPLAFHANARSLAQLALVAERKGKFAPVHSWLFDNSQKSYGEKVKAVSAILGVSEKDLQDEAKSRATQDALTSHIVLGQKLQITGTPTLYVIAPDGKVFLGNQVEQAESLLP